MGSAPMCPPSCSIAENRSAYADTVTNIRMGPIASARWIFPTPATDSHRSSHGIPSTIDLRIDHPDMTRWPLVRRSGTSIPIPCCMHSHRFDDPHRLPPPPEFSSSTLDVAGAGFTRTDSNGSQLNITSPAPLSTFCCRKLKSCTSN